ncbi:type VI secretion system amidase immunity protein Tai4 [Caldimonas brevitalea]
MENSPHEIEALVDSYLARNYHNPLVEPEVKGVRFDMLKCLDLYHSKELEAQVKRFVIKPKRSFRQDNPPSAR